jgi:hypothetical protein
MMPWPSPAGGVLILCWAKKIFSAVMCKKLVYWETANCQKWLKASDIALDSGGYKTDCKWQFSSNPKFQKQNALKRKMA